MDGFTEKKWFIYLGDHHEGPFSLEDVQSRMQQGQLTSTNYVWAEGMADWQMMSQVDAFGPILMPLTPVAPPRNFERQTELAPALAAAGPSSDFNAISLEPRLSTGSAIAMGAIAEPALVATRSGPSIQLSAANAHAEMIEELPPSEEIAQEIQGQKKALAQSMAKAVALLLVLGGIGIAYTEGYLKPLLNSQSVHQLTDQLSGMAEPLLTSLGISPLPKLNDVEPSEYEELKTAAKANIAQAGPQFAIALENGDLMNPLFYISSNIPDGAIFDIYVEGIPDSLLGSLSMNAKTQVTIGKKFGRTSAIQLPVGYNSLPRGEYTLFIVDPETQPPAVKAQLDRTNSIQTVIAPVSVPRGLKILATKAYFLGGPKDATYTQRLQEYHQKVTEKAQTELTEVKQIEATLESKFNETNQKFVSLRKGKRITPSQKKVWGTYNTQWVGLYQQLSQTFSKLTPQNIQTDYFYGFLYQLAQQTGDSINQLHTLQDSYFTGTIPDLKTFDIQLNEVSSIAQTAIDTFKAKIDQVANRPPTPNGLPKRDPI